MGTFTTSGAVCYKAGANRSTAITEAMFNQFIDDAEASVCTATRYDLIAASAALLASYPHFKPTIGNIAGDLAAIKVIQYDMSGYTSRSEAEDMINVLFNDASTDLKNLINMTKAKENIN